MIEKERKMREGRRARKTECFNHNDKLTLTKCIVLPVQTYYIHSFAFYNFKG